MNEAFVEYLKERRLYNHDLTRKVSDYFTVPEDEYYYDELLENLYKPKPPCYPDDPLYLKKSRLYSMINSVFKTDKLFEMFEFYYDPKNVNCWESLSRTHFAMEFDIYQDDNHARCILMHYIRILRSHHPYLEDFLMAFDNFLSISPPKIVEKIPRELTLYLMGKSHYSQGKRNIFYLQRIFNSQGYMINQEKYLNLKKEHVYNYFQQHINPYTNVLREYRDDGILNLEVIIDLIPKIFSTEYLFHKQVSYTQCIWMKDAFTEPMGNFEKFYELVEESPVFWKEHNDYNIIYLYQEIFNYFRLEECSEAAIKHKRKFQRILRDNLVFDWFIWYFQSCETRYIIKDLFEDLDECLEDGQAVKVIEMLRFISSFEIPLVDYVSQLMIDALEKCQHREFYNKYLKIFGLHPKDMRSIFHDYF